MYNERFSKMRHSGFKAYDIRGIVPTEVNEELAYRVARAYAQLYHLKKISVGYDIRPSSLSIADAVIQGMNDAGVDVYNIGLCGTEMMYFTTFYYGLDGGFMITASHNPANNNGIKIVREKEYLSAQIPVLRILKELLFQVSLKIVLKKDMFIQKKL